MIRLHLEPCLGARDLRSLTVADVDDLVTHLLETGSPPSARSIEIALGILRMILSDAVAIGLLTANVVSQWRENQPRGHSASKARPVEEGRVLDSQEREQLLEEAARVAPHYSPFFLFLAETGCRWSEAVNLRWSDVDHGIARAIRKKTGGRPDDVELSARLIEVLRPMKPTHAHGRRLLGRVVHLRRLPSAASVPHRR